LLDGWHLEKDPFPCRKEWVMQELLRPPSVVYTASGCRRVMGRSGIEEGRLHMFSRWLLFLLLLPASVSCASQETRHAKLPDKLLLQVVTKEEDPESGDAPGEQSLIHKLYLIDVPQQRILGEIALGVWAMVSYCEENRVVWVAQRHGKKHEGTRLREFRLPDLSVQTDVKLPIALHVPTDALGRFHCNDQMVVLEPKQVVLIGTLPDEVGSCLLRISVSGPDHADIEALNARRDDFVEFLRPTARMALLLSNKGDALIIAADGNSLLKKADRGMTPIEPKAEYVEWIHNAAYCPRDQSIVAATSLGRVLLHRREEKTTVIETSASIPEQVSLDPTGKVAAIRHLKDANIDTNGLVIVNLDRAEEIASYPLPSDGAILQVDVSTTLFAEGPKLRLLDTSKGGKAVPQDVFRITGVPVERIIKIVAVGP
jgi:hypothetical protein